MKPNKQNILDMLKAAKGFRLSESDGEIKSLEPSVYLDEYPKVEILWMEYDEEMGVEFNVKKDEVNVKDNIILFKCTYGSFVLVCLDAKDSIANEIAIRKQRIDDLEDDIKIKREEILILERRIIKLRKS